MKKNVCVYYIHTDVIFCHVLKLSHKYMNALEYAHLHIINYCSFTREFLPSYYFFSFLLFFFPLSPFFPFFCVRASKAEGTNVVCSS